MAFILYLFAEILFLESQDKNETSVTKIYTFSIVKNKKTFIFKLSCIKKAELCYVYGYGCVLPSLNYKVKKKKEEKQVL